MARETIAIEQQKNVIVYNNIPTNILFDDLSGDEIMQFKMEMQEINELYEQYKNGVDFTTEGTNNDYVASNLRYKKAAQILNKEARFLFGTPPSFYINKDDIENDKSLNTQLQDFVDIVLKTNRFNTKIIKAVRDCFIGKRVALVVDINNNGICVNFYNSLQFIHWFDDINGDDLKKFISFYNMRTSKVKEEQRWYKKTYELIDGFLYIEEKVFDGLGKEIEIITEKQITKLTFIPVRIILNDGLLGDDRGVSELGYLVDYESYFSKLANLDKDAGRRSMNPIKWTTDANNNSTQKLPTSPGSYWDLQSDVDKGTDFKAQVGILEPQMNYSTALDTTLNRIENVMYNEVDVPNIIAERMPGVFTSNRTISALYWGLKVRCDEKMLEWESDLYGMVDYIIRIAKEYKKIVYSVYDAVIPEIKYDITVENNYPLPEDVYEEKNMDIIQVSNQTMSRLTYIKKHLNLSDDEAQKELEQIRKEMDMFAELEQEQELEGTESVEDEEKSVDNDLEG